MPEATLDAVRPVLTLFYEALAGRPVTLVARASEHDLRDTRTTIRLPDHVHGAVAPRAWYRIAVAHRALHEDAGTFAFRWDRPSARFARLLPDRTAFAALPRESDLDAFFRLFGERPLALELFTLLEDLRIEAVLARTLPGLRADLAAVRAAELARRPALDGLRPRVVLLEVLARLSLGERGTVALPSPLAAPARVLASLAAVLADAGGGVAARHASDGTVVLAGAEGSVAEGHAGDATVEDTVEATLRAYAAVTRVAALGADAALATVDLSGAGDHPGSPGADERPDAPSAGGSGRSDGPLIVFPEAERPRLEGDEILAAAPAPIGYRDLLGWRHSGHAPPSPLDQEALYRLLPSSEEGEPTPASPLHLAELVTDEAPPSGPLPHEHHELLPDEPALADGSLARAGPGEWLYPEWDHVRGELRARWCRVRETRLPAGPSTRFFRETVQSYAALVPELRRNLERLAPRGLRRVRGLRDGDELDLDAAIEAFTDLRAGVEPGERLFAALERERRDIATLFLFDVSSSTAERVEAPALAHRPPSGRAYHRIIDVEREAIALLMAALDAVGDAFGVYAFSGAGRADVRIQVLKELGERLSGAVASRLGAVKPVHTTRMGAAVRHATARLRRHEARTRLLVLISDGRPFDLDYGQEYGEGAEVDYAIRDTRAALGEARAAGVEPFVLTVDPAGGDYLRELAGGLDYEVLADTASLPLRLLALYRRLAA